MTVANYAPGNFLKIDDPAALGKYVSQETQKIANSISLANQAITADEANIATNTTNIAANTANLAAMDAAWTSYSPVTTAGTGTLTTVSSTGRYKQFGKTVMFEATINITTNGTGASYLLTTLPVTANATHYYVVNAAQLPGVQCTGFVEGPVDPTKVLTIRYDNTYPGGTGIFIAITGIYEAA